MNIDKGSKRKTWAAFNAWARSPTDLAKLSRLQEAMRDYELIVRLRSVMPKAPAPDQSMPARTDTTSSE